MNRTGTEFRVGIFVLIALTIGGILIFTIGERRNLFTQKSTYFTYFTDVGGLRPGSPVRMGGVDVGVVADVSLNDKGRTRVDFGVNTRAAHLVRKGSKVQISAKGLLGDKLITVTIGTGRELENGSLIPSEEVKDLATYMQQASGILSDAQATARHLNVATTGLETPEIAEDIKKSTRSLAKILGQVSDGHGTAARLVNDPELANNISETLQNARTASAELAAASHSLRQISDEVRAGDGTAHEIIYGRNGVELANNLADASNELAQLLQAARTENGAVHSLIYDQAGGQLVQNMAQASEDLRGVVADVRAGRGTIGALLQDPSVYEDIKRLVGELERNEILRALVRYSIRNDDREQPPVSR